MGTLSFRTRCFSSPPRAGKQAGNQRLRLGSGSGGGCLEHLLWECLRPLPPLWVKLRPVPLRWSDISEMGNRAPSGRPAVAPECCSNIKLALRGFHPILPLSGFGAKSPIMVLEKAQLLGADPGPCGLAGRPNFPLGPCRPVPHPQLTAPRESPLDPGVRARAGEAAHGGRPEASSPATPTVGVPCQALNVGRWRSPGWQAGLHSALFPPLRLPASPGPDHQRCAHCAITEWGYARMLRLPLLASRLLGRKAPSSYRHGVSPSRLRTLQLRPSWVRPPAGPVLFKGRLWGQGERGEAWSAVQ